MLNAHAICACVIKTLKSVISVIMLYFISHLLIDGYKDNDTNDTNTIHIITRDARRLLRGAYIYI